MTTTEIQNDFKETQNGKMTKTQIYCQETQNNYQETLKDHFDTQWLKQIYGRKHKMIPVDAK